MLTWFMLVFSTSFIIPLVISWRVMRHINMDKMDILAMVVGFLIAFFVSGILYLSVATISHNLLEFYSYYGSEFSEFYVDLSGYIIMVNSVIVILVWFDRACIINKNFVLSVLISYQLSLLLFFMFNPLFVVLLEKFGLVDLSIEYFANSWGILPEQLDIRDDLIHPKFSNKSYIQMSLFFLANHILASLIATKLCWAYKNNHSV